MATSISTALRNGMADFAVDAIDGGSGPGKVEIRTGTKPATVATAATGTLLGTMVCTDPAFGAAVNGVATANPLAPDSAADNTGTAGWFRAYDSNNVAVLDGTCGLSGSGADMILDTVAIIAGGTITVTGWTVTMPAG